MIQNELSHSVLVTVVSYGSAAGTTAVNSTILDMSGWDGVMFVATLGTIVDTSVVTLTAKENTANSTSSATTVTGGATASLTASTSSNCAFVVDVVRPSKRYVYANLTRTVANATLQSIVAIQYRGRRSPVSQPASVVGYVVTTPEA